MTSPDVLDAVSVYRGASGCFVDLTYRRYGSPLRPTRVLGPFPSIDDALDELIRAAATLKMVVP